MSLGVGVQLAQHRETSRSCLKTRTDQKKKNRTAHLRVGIGWAQMALEKKRTTGDFKESSCFMVVWMQEEWGMA